MTRCTNPYNRRSDLTSTTAKASPARPAMSEKSESWQDPFDVCPAECFRRLNLGGPLSSRAIFLQWNLRRTTFVVLQRTCFPLPFSFREGKLGAFSGHQRGGGGKDRRSASLSFQTSLGGEHQHQPSQLFNVYLEELLGFSFGVALLTCT